MEWGEQKLSSLCDMFTDGDWVESKDQSAEGVRLIQTGNVGEGVFKDRRDKRRFISEETFSRLKCTEILEGDCLVSRLPDPVGRSCLIPFTGEKMITAVDCTIIRLNRSHLLPEFFNYFTQSYAYLNVVESLTSGATRKRISRKNLGEVPIPLPPIPEQQRIVAILDQAFADIEKARANAEKNLKNARELFDSYLNQVFSQRGEGWKETTLGESCEFSNGKAHEKSIDENGAFIVVNSKFISQAGAVVKRTNELKHPLNIGDIAMVMSDVPNGKALAKCFIVPEENKYSLNQRICSIKSDLFFTRFLYYQLNRNPFLLAFDNKGSQANLRKDEILSCPLWLPSFEKQQEISSKLDSLMNHADFLLDTYSNKLASLDELKKSLLQQAFSGELTKTEGHAA